MFNLMPALSIMPTESGEHAYVDFTIYDRGDDVTKGIKTVYHVTYYSKGDISAVKEHQVLPTMVRLLEELTERVSLSAQNPSLEAVAAIADETDEV